MDLAKIIKEASDAILASLRYLGRYFRELLWLTVRPKKFAKEFLDRPHKERFKQSFIFLFTTLLLLETALALTNRYLDARNSLSDVGLLIVFQSGMLWKLSWEALLQQTLPLTLALPAISWLVAQVCGRERSERTWLRDIFPYVLWRTFVLILMFSFLISALYILVFLLFENKIGLMFFILLAAVYYPKVAVIGLLELAALPAIWRLGRFLRILNDSASHAPWPKTRWFAYRLIACVSLLIPVWWSLPTIAPAADKVAARLARPMQLSTNNDDFSITLNLRNLSGVPLVVKSDKTSLEWWDDEHPVTDLALSGPKRVPNGVFPLKLPSDTELTDSFRPITFTGKVSEAELRPNSIVLEDFLLGPDRPDKPPTAEDFTNTRDAFREILNEYHKGRIDVVLEVETEGGTVSTRSISVFTNSGDFWQHLLQ